MGSTVYLFDPGNINIINSTFKYNQGLMGSCVYYSESRSDFILNLQNNQFLNNIALYGGGAIYFQNKFDLMKFKKENFFFLNSAQYGNDYATRPIRFQLFNNKRFSEYSNKKQQYILQIIPGQTEINLNFQLLDYFENHITSINHESAEIQIRNFNNFTQNSSPSNKIDGKTTVAIQNGFFNKDINFFIFIFE